MCQNIGDIAYSKHGLLGREFGNEIHDLGSSLWGNDGIAPLLALIPQACHFALKRARHTADGFCHVDEEVEGSVQVGGDALLLCPLSIHGGEDDEE